MQSRHVLKICLVSCSSGRQQEHYCSNVSARSSRNDGVGTELRLVVNLQFISVVVVEDAEQIVTFRFGDPSLASMYAFRRIKSPLAAAACAPHHRFFASRVAAMACAVVILGTGLRMLAFGDCNSEVLEEGRAVKVGGMTTSSASSGSTMRLGPDGEPMAGLAGEGSERTGGGGRGGGLGGLGGGGSDAAGDDMMSYIKDM